MMRAVYGSTRIISPMARSDARAFFDELVNKSYLELGADGKGLLTPAFEKIISDYRSWACRLSLLWQAQGYMDENGLLTAKAQQDKPDSCRLRKNFPVVIPVLL